MRILEENEKRDLKGKFKRSTYKIEKQKDGVWSVVVSHIVDQIHTKITSWRKVHMFTGDFPFIH